MGKLEAVTQNRISPLNPVKRKTTFAKGQGHANLEKQYPETRYYKLEICLSFCQDYKCRTGRMSNIITLWLLTTYFGN